MRWKEFKEKTQIQNTISWEYYNDPTFVKELINDYVDGNMEIYELGTYLAAINATGENLYSYYNSVQLNSYDKNLLRYLSNLADTQSLDKKYFNYCDKGYLYGHRPFILLPCVKQELADMLVVADNEEACLEYFKVHHYDMEIAKRENFSNGSWKEDINTFINGWKDTIKYLNYITEMTKIIIQYFESDLDENPQKIKQFFFDYTYELDFFLLCGVYDTYIKYYDFDHDVADEIANHFKSLQHNEYEKITTSPDIKNDFNVIFDVD